MSMESPFAITVSSGAVQLQDGRDVADLNEPVTIGPTVGFKIAENPQSTPPLRWWTPVVLGVITLLLVAGGCRGGDRPSTKDGKTGDDTVAKAKVPEVTAKTLAEARSILELAGFVAGDVKRRVDTKPPDIVLEQMPAPGATAVKGDKVTLVATDESLVLVPPLDGKTEDQARFLLGGLLSVDRVERNCSKSREPVNSVYESNPRSGDAVARTTKLLLRVKDDCVELPQLVGMDRSAALVRLNALGLLGSPVAGPIDARRADSVESQSPNEGALLVKGSVVKLRLFDQGPVAPPPPPPAPIALSGLWSGNDGGTYAIRQVGSEVWWYGQDGAGGKSWTNVFHGRINGSQITGNWADVPVGNVSSSGVMTLEIIGSNRLSSSFRTGGFGGSQWDRLATVAGRSLNAKPANQWRQDRATNVVSGVWNGNDGGMYAIRQVGSEVWWYGQDGAGGRTWTNVFHGRIVGQQIIGNWADVPIGNVSNAGAMTLKTGNNRIEALSKTGGFGGSIWTR